LPVACQIGQTCFVQHYVDQDPGPGARDYQCGSLSYDGHNGTDFRLPSAAAQTAGIDVLAAADGKVLRIRDGMEDVSIRAGGQESVDGSECGNGAVITHAGGWETQYCHMAQGSVSVRPGDEVRAGQKIGRIGLSGMTEFPHLHFTVRQNGRVIDPFALNARSGACGSGTAIWDEAASRALAYRPIALINAGFAPSPVTMEGIESGGAERARPDLKAPALVAFIRAIGLKARDVQKLSLVDPTGAIIAENKAKPLDRDKAQWMMFGGVRRPASGWRPGTYRARYTVERNGATAFDQGFTIDLKP
jgi:murein DD-endopeptidase MepM/ murein hydrolase activator NlpD